MPDAVEKSEGRSVWRTNAVLRAHARRFTGLDDGPVPPRERLADWLREAGGRFTAAPPDTGRREGVPQNGGYEEAVARGEVPTRAGSWHDAFNVLAFARFGRAKAALHARVLALRRARLGSTSGGTPGQRGRRSREEDALALVDECALLVCGPLAGLARFGELRERGDLAALDGVVRSHDLRVACFGHALLEHLVLGRPPIGAGVVLLAVSEPGDAALDRALAEAIEEGRFSEPRLSPTVPWPHPIVDRWVSAS